MSQTIVKKPVRCAIYTRKSTEEGLQQEFNTLHAQRESGEAFIAAQKHEGWVCCSQHYDDGGFTGGNLDRPAVARLLKDIEAGLVDCVVVYKVDRLSRSLLDFARMMEVFDRHHVSFVSVTQQFNTTHSMGRLTLNILLSFAQFEREIISERTRDKIAAARRRGRFAGGKPVLGYDLLSSPAGPRLLVNGEEAERVRAIFQLYLKHEALIPTVTELNRRGWTTKAWQTKAGKRVGGRPFDKSHLHHLLTNVVYLGKVRHHQEVHDGVHEQIVDDLVWQKVQGVLGRNRQSGGASIRNKHGALLKGLLRCSPCGCSMGHAYTAKGSKRYRYYVCLKAQKQGWNACPSKSLPAGEIETFVVERIRSIGRDPALLAQTIKQAKAQALMATKERKIEERKLAKECSWLNIELAKHAGNPERGAKVSEQLQKNEQRRKELHAEIGTTELATLDEQQTAQALAMFDPLWQTLIPREQARILRLLIERVDYDGNAGTVAITFRPSGIKTLCAEQAKEIAA